MQSIQGNIMNTYQLILDTYIDQRKAIKRSPPFFFRINMLNLPIKRITKLTGACLKTRYGTRTPEGAIDMLGLRDKYELELKKLATEMEKIIKDNEEVKPLDLYNILKGLK